MRLKGCVQIGAAFGSGFKWQIEFTEEEVEVHEHLKT